MDIGFGMRPDLIGKGLGAAFVKAGIEFGKRHYKYTGDRITLSVANSMIELLKKSLLYKSNIYITIEVS